jgi:VWFA-related protein
MRNPRVTAFVLLLLLLVWALGEQVAAQEGDSAQTGVAPQITPSSQYPVLSHRPPPNSPKPLSKVTPEGRIQLDVVVTDAAGKAVPGLEPWDFKVLDDSQPRKILSFHSYDGITVKPDPPVEVILLLDVANLPFQQVSFVRQQVAKFLSQDGGQLVQPVTIILLTDTGMRIQPRPSTDGKALLSVLGQVKGNIGTMNPAMGAIGALQRFQLSVHQLAAIAENEARKPGRKLLVWVGPGWPVLDASTSVYSEKNQQRYFDAIVELSTKLREARMVLYSVAPANSTLDSGTRIFLYQDFLKPVKSAKQADTGNLALKVLVTQSGGRILGPDNDVTRQINSCITDANSFYRVSFDPPQAQHADEYHDLKVQVDKPGLTTRTDTGYYNQPQERPN